MKIKFIKPSYEIDMLGQTGIEKLKHIEKVARLCYKTEDKITDTSYEKLIKHLIKNKHGAMLEHASFAVKFIANRAFTHELVRHRIPSFAQESQRYVGYGNAIEFIIPSWCNIEPFEWDGWEYNKDLSNGGFLGRWQHPNCDFNWGIESPEFLWVDSMAHAAGQYGLLIQQGWKPEQARDVLPNATKTEIWINTNIREWMHIKGLRDHHTASPQMIELMNPLFKDLDCMIPLVFQEILS